MKQFNVRVGLGIILGGLLSSGIAVTPAAAAPVTFDFTGVVSHVDKGVFTPSGNFNANQKITGSYTFNDATSDSKPLNVHIGAYDGAITALNVHLGPMSGPSTYTATLLSPGSGFIEIRDQSSDRYIVQAALTGLPVHGYSPLTFRMELIDSNGSVFSNDHLPTTPPSLSSFSANSWRIVFQDSVTHQARVIGSITSLTAVPLPAAVILFGAGLVALVGLGAGSWRKRTSSLA